MKKVTLTLVLALFVNIIHAQNPLIKQWDYRFGGIGYDRLYSFQQTSDKGFILGGFTESDSSGDITEHTRGYRDFWLIKVDSSGSKQWDKRFGGNSGEAIRSLKQTTDSGYILGGYSSSDSSGDVSQNNLGIYSDFWVVKIDSNGNKQWDKRFGGTSDDEILTVDQTYDGGFILGGMSISDIGGDKSQANWGSWDYWIVKIDSLGTKLWDKRYGGTGREDFRSLQETSDKGFILGGYSESGISGDKSEPNWDTVCNPICSSDFWIIKIDSVGIKEWDKRYGGYRLLSADQLTSLQQTIDGGYILGGFSNSGHNGDRSQPNWDTICANNYCKGDFWIVKTDSLGNKIWDRRFGGLEHEHQIDQITQTNDNGFLLSGITSSDIGGDKTENNLGAQQQWIVKTDLSGNKIWDKTIFLPSLEPVSLSIQSSDGCYVFATHTQADTGGYKTQPRWNTTCIPVCSYDYWIVKFCDTTLTTFYQSITNSLSFSIYPNPTQNIITITFDNHNYEKITIMNVIGEIINEMPLASSLSKIDFDVASLASGIYFIKIDNKVKMFMKE